MYPLMSQLMTYQQSQTRTVLPKISYIPLHFSLSNCGLNVVCYYHPHKYQAQSIWSFPSLMEKPLFYAAWISNSSKLIN